MTRRKKNTLRRLIESVRRAAPSFARYAAWLGQRFRSAVLRRLGPPGPTIIIDARRRQSQQHQPAERAQAAESRLTMVIVSERLVRLIPISTGLRYVVQVPEPACPIPGWRAYSLLVVTHGGDPDLRLTLYERIDGLDDHRAA